MYTWVFHLFLLVYIIVFFIKELSPLSYWPFFCFRGKKYTGSYQIKMIVVASPLIIINLYPWHKSQDLLRVCLITWWWTRHSYGEFMGWLKSSSRLFSSRLCRIGRERCGIRQIKSTVKYLLKRIPRWLSILHTTRESFQTSSVFRIQMVAQ